MALSQWLDALTHQGLHVQDDPITAPDVGAGTFGAGNFVFPGELDVTTILRVKGTVTNPGSARFWTGIEIANPTSDPFIDFHRSTNPEEATDYNIRLINHADDALALDGGWLNVGGGASTGANHYTGWTIVGEGFIELFGPNPGTPFIDFHVNSDTNDFSVRLIATTVDLLEVHGGNLEINDVAQVGSNPFYGTNYAWFGHKDMGGSGQYCLMQDNLGSTLINAASGKDIVMRINNGSTRLSVDTNGLYFYNIVGPAGTAIGLSANKVVLQSSSERFKRGIESLERQGDESVLDGLWRLRPIRFFWNEQAPDMDELRATMANDRAPNGFPGLSAEEVAVEFPEAVHHDLEGNVESIDANVMIALLLAGLRQLRRRINRLEAL